MNNEIKTRLAQIRAGEIPKGYKKQNMGYIHLTGLLTNLDITYKNTMNCQTISKNIRFIHLQDQDLFRSLSISTNVKLFRLTWGIKWFLKGM